LIKLTCVTVAAGVEQGCGGRSYWIVVKNWKWEGRASDGPRYRWPFGTLVLQRVCKWYVMCHLADLVQVYGRSLPQGVCLPHLVWPQPITHLCAFSMCHASFISAPLPQHLLSGGKNFVAKEVKSHVCGRGWWY